MRLLKTKIAKILVILFIIQNFYLFNTIYSNNTNIKDNKAQRLNNIIETQLKHAEQLNYILQHITQTINKENINIKNKKNIRKWVSENQEIILNILKNKNLSDDKFKINKIIIAINQIITNIDKALETNFKNLEKFDSIQIDLLTKNKIKMTELEDKSLSNSNLLDTLQTEVNDIGLSGINKLAREIDLLNDKYGFTKYINFLPLITAAPVIAFTLSPMKYFENIPILSSVKRFVGEYKFSNIALQQGRGALGLLSDFRASNEFKLVRDLILISIACAKFNSTNSAVKEFFRNQWDSLKGFNNSELIKANQTYEHITLDDEKLIGLDSQIEELKNLVRYITNPEIYDRTNSNLEKGVILVGPSRNGKTYAAQALCGTLNKTMKKQGYNSRFKFIEVKWGEVEWTSEGIKKLIDKAKNDAPCVLFIDEIHNLSLQTKGWGGKTLSEFLTGMSGINSENDARHQVILLAATNQPERLDTALLQPGRFGTVIHFEKPNYQNRKKYFEVIFKHNAIDTNDIDINALVKQTANCSYGDLEYIVKNARFQARTKAKKLTQEDLQNRIDKHIYKIKPELNLTNLEKKYLAAHQAGHALAFTLLNSNKDLLYVTIKGIWKKIKETKANNTQYHKKQIKYGKTFTYNQEECINIETEEEKYKLCQIKLAGLIAEKILLGSSAYQYKNKQKQNTFHNKDKKQALNYIKEIVYQGIEEEDIPKNLKKELDQKILDMLKAAEQSITELLTNNKIYLEKIAKKLEEKETISGKEVSEIINT